MDSMYLPEVEGNQNLEGGYSELIQSLRQSGAAPPQIMYLFAFKDSATKHLRNFTQAVMRGPSPLTPAFRELIAAFVSTRNQCLFCSHSHIAVAAKLYESSSLVDAVVKDYRSAPISEPEKALLAYLEKLTLTPSATAAKDVAQLHQAGWSDEAIYDAVTVCALFNFYNRWVDGSGVQDMSETGYALSAERLAAVGYSRDPSAA